MVDKVFDCGRKLTYKNLGHWYKELRENRPKIPCFVVANKIDGQLMHIHSCTLYHLSIIVDPRVTELNFTFAKKHKMPFYYVSASDGTNVVKVSV